jgi:hypothetical protein
VAAKATEAMNRHEKNGRRDWVFAPDWRTDESQLKALEQQNESGGNGKPKGPRGPGRIHEAHDLPVKKLDGGSRLSPRSCTRKIGKRKTEPSQ